MRNFEFEVVESEYDEKDNFVIAYSEIHGFPEELQEKYNPSTSAWVFNLDWNERYNGPQFDTCDDSDVQFFFDGDEVSKEEFQKTLGLTDEEIKQITDESKASAGHAAYRYEDSIYNNRN